MIKKYFKKRYIIFSAVLVLASCVTQKYQQPGLAVTGQLYRDTAAATNPGTNDSLSADDTLSMANISYKQLFADTILQNLITEGIHENLNLKIAIQRINESYASFRQSKAAYWPS